MQYVEIFAFLIRYLIVTVDRSWWFSSTKEDVDYFSSREFTDTDQGFQESLHAIDLKIKEDGPFDGLLGFSQGGAMAAIVATTRKCECFQNDNVI